MSERLEPHAPKGETRGDNPPPPPVPEETVRGIGGTAIGRAQQGGK